MKHQGTVSCLCMFIHTNSMSPGTRLWRQGEPSRHSSVACVSIIYFAAQALGAQSGCQIN